MMKRLLCRVALHKRYNPALDVLLALALIGLLGCSNRNSYRLAGFKRQDDGTIAFDLRKGEQRIKATCNASQSECSNLALKAGNSVDCYMHASADFIPEAHGAVKINDADGVKIDAYGESGLVCHAGEGHGKLFIMHTQKCEDMKKVTLGLEAKKFVVLPSDKPSVAPDKWAQSSRPTTYSDLPNGAKILWDDPETWTAYVPAVFDDGQIKKFVQELNDKYGNTGQLPIPYGATIGAQNEWDQHKTNADAGPWDKYRTPASDSQTRSRANLKPQPLLPSAYEGYVASADSPLRFCKHEKDRYFSERGKEVQDDTVLLTVLESSVEKH